MNHYRDFCLFPSSLVMSFCSASLLKNVLDIMSSLCKIEIIYSVK